MTQAGTWPGPDCLLRALRVPLVPLPCLLFLRRSLDTPSTIRAGADDTDRPAGSSCKTVPEPVPALSAPSCTNLHLDRDSALALVIGDPERCSAPAGWPAADAERVKLGVGRSRCPTARSFLWSTLRKPQG